MQGHKRSAAESAAKWQFKQAVVVALITSLTGLVFSVLKIVIDTNTIENLKKLVSKQNPKQLSVQNIAGLYSWQWNENGWTVLGSVDISADGNAQITLEEWMKCESENKNRSVPIAQQRGPATFKPIDGSSDVNVFLPVQFLRYDRNCKQTGMDPELSTIRGRIKPVAAYSGTVDYVSGRGHFAGGMTLVRMIEAAP
jgi:nucleoside diphosphate kinase